MVGLSSLPHHATHCRRAGCAAGSGLPRPLSLKHRLKAAQDRGPDLGSDDDPPDEIIGNTVDLGALAAEFLGLALDPYPRKPGAEFAALTEDPPGAPAAPSKVSPFAILKNARPKDK